MYILTFTLLVRYLNVIHYREDISKTCHSIYLYIVKPQKISILILNTDLRLSVFEYH